MNLTHVAGDGSIAMVDVAAKPPMDRRARARAIVRMNEEAGTALREATLKKGDALVTAQIAGIQAAKQTATLIPLTHPLPLESIDVAFTWEDDLTLRIESTVRTIARTGVEMEALTAVAVAALTIYDMCKALDREIVIESVRLIEKTKGPVS
jgi:cyclic pyranopterin phosphate synthase